MTRKFNFNPGPSTLPFRVLEQVRDEIVEYHSEGMSIVEASHRSKFYDDLHNEAIGLFRDLLSIPDNYQVLFLGGGATLQFSMIPLNLLTEGKRCDFTVTGTWAKKAYADAKKVGDVNVVFDGAETQYMTLPDLADLDLDPEAVYLHITSNETIQGIQWHQWPSTREVPIVADMSSDILSRRLPIEKFGLIYAGAQKNLGPAGVTLVILREDLLQRCNQNLTAYLSYTTHVGKNSLYNTPPVFAIYMTKLVLEWVKQNGGMDAIEAAADKRSSAVYQVIDDNPDFYRCPVQRSARSKMNVVFRLPTEELEKLFIAQAAEHNLHGLKGHRSVGGCRASIYNAMPVEGALCLAQFMKDFMAKHG